MTDSSLFIDTSIQISRIGTDEDEIVKIDGVLTKHDFKSTSTYVRLEFKQSYIQDLAYLYRNLVEKKSLAEVMLIAKGLTSHPGHSRKLSMILGALAKSFGDMKSFHSDSNVDRDLAAQLSLYFEIILEDIWDWFNEESVDYISDCTECIRSREPPVKKVASFDVKVGKCKSQKIRCRLNKFFKDKEVEFKAIRDYINGLQEEAKDKPEELKKIVAVIEKGVADPDSLCNSQECRGLGDALVAVEAFHFKELFTKDIDQAKVICGALKLKSNLLS